MKIIRTITKILLVLILINFISSIVQAKSSPDFIEYLTSMVYEDCKGALHENKPITRDFVKQEIIKIDDRLPLGLIVGGVELFPEVLGCTKNEEKYTLRVNFDEYYWRDRKVGNSATYNLINQSIENVVAEKINQTAVQGNENIINTGQINYLTIGGISFTISLSFSVGLYFLVKRRRRV
ncbi:MAG: hypothetical protein ACKKMO_01460 [Candidatus Nealsonbacteria bacterium]